MMMMQSAQQRFVSEKKQAVPAGTQLKRKRAWDLFLDGQDGAAGAAVLVVSKKSIFSLEDARTALGIMNDEATARCLNGEAKGVQQLLLTTRAGVAPAADAFLKGAQANLHASSSGDTSVSVFAIMRWEKLQQLVQDGGLGRHLAASSSNRRDGDNGSMSKAPPFALPTWLLEERERGLGAVFDLHSPFQPAGDQPEAIKALSRGLKEGKRHQTLLGATGTVRCHVYTQPPAVCDSLRGTAQRRVVEVDARYTTAVCTACGPGDHVACLQPQGCFFHAVHNSPRTPVIDLPCHLHFRMPRPDTSLVCAGHRGRRSSWPM